MNSHAIDLCRGKPPSLGFGSWLTLARMGPSTANQLIHTALDGGITFFDTADIYDYGGAEMALAKALESTTRQKILLASKVYFPMSDDPLDSGLSRRHIFASIDNSLKRLKTDYLDLYQCHRYDDGTPLEETVQAMGDLVQAGKIRHWGTSTWSSTQLRDSVAMAHALGVSPPATEQARYNLLCREVEKEVVPAARELGMGLLWWSPLAQGILSGKYQFQSKPPSESRAADPGRIGDFLDQALQHKQAMHFAAQFHQLAQEIGHPTASLALSWCLDKQPGSTVLVGARTPEQLNEALQATEIAWTDDIRVAVDKMKCGQDWGL